MSQILRFLLFIILIAAVSAGVYYYFQGERGPVKKAVEETGESIDKLKERLDKRPAQEPRKEPQQEPQQQPQQQPRQEPEKTKPESPQHP